jgi:hypothetical protein
MPERGSAGCEVFTRRKGRPPRGRAWAVVACFALLSRSKSVWASSVDVRCPELPATERNELQARARLLLSSAGYESARVGVECDTSGAWLVWTDGSRTTIDAPSGIVEGALDAIESRVSAARSERAATGRNPTTPSAELTPPGMETTDSTATSAGARGATGNAESEAKDAAEKKTSAVVASAHAPLEGGISLGTTTEFWSGATLGMGLSVDVGVGVSEHLAIVVGQAARLGVPAPADGEITVYDLRAGFGIGAPYLRRTGLGLVLLGGAERLAISDAPVFGSNGFWVWAVTGSLGVRASVQAGAVDLWLGADVVVRSKSLEVKGGAVEGVPDVSGSLSLGCLFPAFTHETTAQFGPHRQVSTSR